MSFDFVRSRVVVVVVSAVCLVHVASPLRAGPVAAAGGRPGIQSPAASASAVGISGTVLRDDGRTPVANMRLRLRNLDTSAIVGQTVSDGNGVFSFPVSEPGLYVVEAVDDDSGVRAVSQPVKLGTSPITTNVILPARRMGAWSALAAAAGAGLAVLVTGGTTAVSPEQ